MYRIDHTGPWPHIDIGASHGQRSDAHAEATYNAALNVLLDTANLGGNSKAFVSNTWALAIAATLTQRYTTSFGVLLNSLENIQNYDDSKGVFVDISMSARANIDDYSGKGASMFAWIGLVDSGTTPVDGWNATHNKVTNYSLIPCASQDDQLDLSCHLLLRDILSGSIPDDQKLAVGFSLLGNADSISCINYMIRAEYALSPIPVHTRY